MEDPERHDYSREGEVAAPPLAAPPARVAPHVRPLLWKSSQGKQCHRWMRRQNAGGPQHTSMIELLAQVHVKDW